LDVEQATAGSGHSYAMGRTSAETRRLVLQSELYAAQSEQLLRMAGVRTGMRVLDVGCGAGDLTLLAARLVGPTGSVVGVDIDADVLAVAQRRAAEAGVGNVSVVCGDIVGLRRDLPFDALVGRLIVMHLPDSVAAVRTMAGLLRPGGVIALQEVNGSRARTVPAVPLVDQCLDWVVRGVRAAGARPDAGEDLPALFHQAGLSVEGVAVAIPALLDAERAAAYWSMTLGSLLPFVLRDGVVTNAEIDADTLHRRMRDQLRDAGAITYLPELVGVWSRVQRAELTTAKSSDAGSR
jgi:2-polyprenyl-3-methyl-5-hydroxy-6-metoxy-1,4-benzoquinol methylase